MYFCHFLLLLLTAFQFWQARQTDIFIFPITLIKSYTTNWGKILSNSCQAIINNFFLIKFIVSNSAMSLSIKYFKWTIQIFTTAVLFLQVKIKCFRSYFQYLLLQTVLLAIIYNIIIIYVIALFNYLMIISYRDVNIKVCQMTLLFLDF